MVFVFMRFSEWNSQHVWGDGEADGDRELHLDDNGESLHRLVSKCSSLVISDYGLMEANGRWRACPSLSVRENVYLSLGLLFPQL